MRSSKKLKIAVKSFKKLNRKYLKLKKSRGGKGRGKKLRGFLVTNKGRVRLGAYYRAA